MLRFNDGMTFNTEGPYRVVHKPDGWYLVGHGMLLPIESAEEGHTLMAEQLKIDERKGETR